MSTFVRGLCNIVFSYVPDLSYIIVAISLPSLSSVANYNSRSISFINQIIIKSLLLRESSSSLSTIILFLLYQDRYCQDHPLTPLSLTFILSPPLFSYNLFLPYFIDSFSNHASFHNVTPFISSVNRSSTTL